MTIGIGRPFPGHRPHLHPRLPGVRLGVLKDGRVPARGLGGEEVERRGLLRRQAQPAVALGHEHAGPACGVVLELVVPGKGHSGGGIGWIISGELCFRKNNWGQTT